MNTYDIIFEALCDRVESGELTLEDAEVINDLAYDRYFTEMKSKAGYRRQKYEKEHDYDHKTKTVVHDGERVPYTFKGGSQKRSKLPGAEAEFYDGSGKNVGRNAHTTKVKGIQMDNASFNMKHPKAHEFIAGHEYLGHVNDVKRERATNKAQKPTMTEMYKLLSDEGRKKCAEVRRLGRKSRNNTITEDELKSLNSLITEIKKEMDRNARNDPRFRDFMKSAQISSLNSFIEDSLKKEISKGNKLNLHGSSPDEYTSDYASASAMKNGKKIAKKALSDMEKRNRSKHHLKYAENQYRRNKDIRTKEDQLNEELACAKKNKKYKNKLVNYGKRIISNERDHVIYTKKRMDNIDRYPTEVHDLVKDSYEDAKKFYRGARMDQIDNLANQELAREDYRDAKRRKQRFDDKTRNVAKNAVKIADNELKLRKKMLDELDKNPDAEYLRKRK